MLLREGNSGTPENSKMNGFLVSGHPGRLGWASGFVLNYESAFFAS
jgi:hypothetical protein